MQGMKVTCHKINSGYRQDYGYDEYTVTEVVSLDPIPTIKVAHASDRGWQSPYLAWFRNGEWVLDLD